MSSKDWLTYAIKKLSKTTSMKIDYENHMIHAKNLMKWHVYSLFSSHWSSQKEEDGADISPTEFLNASKK